MPYGGGVQTTIREVRRQPLGMIVYFRAIAILLIVAGHTYTQAGIRLDTTFDYTLSNLIKGATALFVFISGFLFNHVYMAHYRYTNFLRERAQKILIPYCILTILAILADLIFSSSAAGRISAGMLFRDFALGATFQAYWYIPFIILMYALAPLHRLFTSLRTPLQVAIMIALAVLAGFVQRPISNDNAFQSVVFYLPIYLSGIFLSLNFGQFLPILRRHGYLLLLVAILLATIQAINGQGGNLHKQFFAFQGFEMMGIQKVTFSLGLIGIFSLLSNSPGRIVTVVANTSFAIFFLHPFVLWLLEGHAFFKVTQLPWLNLAVAVVAIVAVCVVTALILRFILQANSKYLTGY